MKIRMLATPKGRAEYQKGEVYDFNGAIEEGYALKFIDRGWAEPADKAAREAAREEQERREAQAKARTEQDARDKAEAEARLKAKMSSAAGGASPPT